MRNHAVRRVAAYACAIVLTLAASSSYAFSPRVDGPSPTPGSGAWFFHLTVPQQVSVVILVHDGLSLPVP
jgi:hypothetical protein